MSQRSQSSSTRAARFSALAGGALALTLVVAGLARCTAVRPQRDAGMTPAVLEVINRTDYSWALAFTREGSAGSVVAVPARQTIRVRIAPGDYRIEQGVDEGTPDAADLAQTITATLAAGQRYRWPLLTLLSDASSTP